MQTVFQSIQTDGVDNFVDKSEHQQQARLAHRNTTLPHIEESAFIELPHRSAVTALHVICINLQLRLGVHMCISGGTKIAVGLLRTGVLCVRAH